MAKPKLPKTKRKNLISGKSESTAVSEKEQDGYFLLSLRHLDREQGQSFFQWEESNILAKGMETLRDYSTRSLMAGVDNDKFIIYGDFPSKDKTDFFHPKHVPEDAQWARIHVNGKVCIIGHVEGNIFHVVFLDKDHRFWISEKKHT